MADHTPVKDPSKWGVLLLGIVLLVAAVLVLVLGLKNTVVNNSTDGERDVATLQTNNALAKEEQQKQQTAMVKSLITPIGTVKSAAPGAEGAEAAPRSGEEVYTKVCSACHSATGLPTAPKINDKAAWETRVAKNGFKGLLEASIAGTSGGMPARAGQNINDEELTSAIAYMTKEAGLTLDIPVAAPAEEAKTEEAAPAEEAKTEEAAPAEDAKTEEAAPAEEAKTEEAAPAEEAKTEEAAPAEDAKTEEAAPAEEVKTEEVAPTEEAKTEEVAPAEEVKTEEVAPTEEAKTEEVAPAEEAKTEEVAPAEEVKTNEGTPAEVVKIDEAAPAEEAKTEEVTFSTGAPVKPEAPIAKPKPVAPTAPTITTETVAEKVEETEAKEATTEKAEVAVVASGDNKEGEKLYKKTCFACHDTGVASSPILGDAAVWAPRIAAGKEVLYSTAINGKGAMPPKGGNASLSDEEVKAVVDYMISKAQSVVK